VTEVNSPQTWVFVGAIMVAVGGVIAAIASYRAAADQTQFERDVRTRLERTISSITGGASYAFLMPFASVEPDAKGGHIRGRINSLALISEGDDPVYDLHVVLEDVSKQGEAAKREFERSGGKTLSTDVFFGSDVRQVWTPGNLPARTFYYQFAMLTLPEDRDMQQYHWTISARNGQTFGEINFVRTTAGWRSASRVVRERTVVKEDVDQEYPRDPDGRVKWQGFGIDFVPGQVQNKPDVESFRVR
jgi:hypothetical protein